MITPINVKHGTVQLAEENAMKSSTRLLIVVVGIGLMLGSSVHGEMTDGKSLEELSAEWWQWALSIPTPDNPLLDPTGAKCAVGQQGPVWFIPVGGSGTRTCSLPDDKPLVFPTLSYVNIDTPNVCGQGPESISVADLRAAAAAVIDGVTNQSVKLDGQVVGNLERVQSPVFEVVLPEDNWFDPQCTAYGNVPGGTYSPSIVDGYFVMLDPPGPGMHTLYVHAEMPGSSLDVTWNLTVLSSQCAGDCNGNGEATIDELLTIAGIALGNLNVGACTPGDANGDNRITIDEILTGANHALSGCPT
jgi:hypothetical protein